MKKKGWNQAWHLKRRWGLTVFHRINNNSVAAHSDARGTDHVWSSAVYILNLAMAEDSVRRCVCAYLPPRIQMRAHAEEHTEPRCGETHPSAVPHLEKPQNQTPVSLFQLPFLPSTVTTPHPSKFSHSFFPPPPLPPHPPCFLSLLSNASMCYHHKHATRLSSHTPQSGRHNKQVQAPRKSDSWSFRQPAINSK